MSLEGKARPLKRAALQEPTWRRHTVADRKLEATAWEQWQREEGGEKKRHREP